jgi:phosphodiesterase/alkaline phosphatase D-like protein
MERSRRDLLRLASSAGVAALGLPSCKPGGPKDSGPPRDTGTDRAPERDPEPDAWDPGGTVDADGFAWGVQVGDPRPDAALVSVWTTAATVRMVLARADGAIGWTEVADQAGLAPVDGRLQVPLAGLDPDTAYSVVFVDEAGGGRSRVARFRTALAADGLRVVTFGATSCLGGNEPWPTLTRAAAEQLDFFGLLGDTVYADGSVTAAEYRLFWDQALRTAGFVDLTASCGVVATWDDHEVDNNWDRGDLVEGQYDAALAEFRAALPQTAGPGGSGIWRVLRWGRVLDVFVLDCRGERAGDAYLSAAQMAWLQSGLLASEARFKVIFNSVPITDLTAIFGAGGAEDRWDGYPAQRSEILSFIADSGIEGVLWVTGDVHYAQVGNVDPAGGVAEDAVEVFVGPGGSFGNVAAELFEGDPQYWWLSSQWNYTRFRCDPVAGTIEVQHIGDAGDVLNAVTLTL